MQLKPFTNTTGHIVHIGTKTLFPNETREVDPRQIPNELRDPPAPAAAAPAATEAFSVTEFLAGSVANIAAQLPALDVPTLDLVHDIEQANPKPRKGVIAAIAEERLRRASEPELSELEQFAIDLRELDDAELAEQAELYTDPQYEAQLEIVRAEQERRAGGANG